ncbi:MAG: alginate lyase family protein, partial [Acidiferrobacterales bacterium]
ELGIRLINWSFTWYLIGGIDSPLFTDSKGGAFRDRWLTSIYQHAHFIHGHFSRYSSANNHLIGESAGLFVAAITWPVWEDSTKWQKVATKQLVREALLQNAPDGVNREQAISYQQFVLDFLLIAALVGRINGVEFPKDYWRQIEKMLEYLASVMDMAGNVPMIGDADDGVVVRLSQESEFCPYRSLLATGAVLFKRADFKTKAGRLDDKTRWLLGSSAESEFKAIKTDAVTLPARRDFPEGGYFILGSDFETDQEIRLIVDAGPLGYKSLAAHGHADALALTLSIGGREFLIDPGTYTYHTRQGWRDYFRGTSAHNTVLVDGQNQSVAGGNFMWLQHAEATCDVWGIGKETERFVGSHNGYTRLTDPVIHEREITLNKTIKAVEITDNLRCEHSHMIERNWHFSENTKVSVDNNGLIVAENDGIKIRLKPGKEIVKALIRRGDTSPIGGWVSRSFDIKSETTTVVWKTEIQGTTRLRTDIDCFVK